MPVLVHVKQRVVLSEESLLEEGYIDAWDAFVKQHAKDREVTERRREYFHTSSSQKGGDVENFMILYNPRDTAENGMDPRRGAFRWLNKRNYTLCYAFGIISLYRAMVDAHTLTQNYEYRKKAVAWWPIQRNTFRANSPSSG